jgi:uncharacterized protein (TIGR03437 family)
LHSSKLIALLACAPTLAAADYTTYVGDTFAYNVTAIAVDANGATYVTGSRAVGPESGFALLTDIFVSKLDPAGNLTLLATLSGKASDQAKGIALDPSGNIYIVGNTSSSDFPLHHPLQSISDRTGSFKGTGFLVKFSADGTVLFSTYLGGTTGYSTLNAVAADSQGNAYVTGETFASNYPHTAGLPAGIAGLGGISAAFFAKISPAGDKILYAGGLAPTTHACGSGSSCLLSMISSYGAAIALDAAGNAYIAGNTRGTGLPATPGALRTDGIGAFVAKVNASGTGLAYVTFLGAANYFPPPSAPGSSPGNNVSAIAADAAGNAYITGSTSDPNFPATSSAYQPKPSFVYSQTNPFAGPPSDAFVAKLNPTGSSMLWATFLGGAGPDAGGRIAIDFSGAVWVSGSTQSTDFPFSSGFSDSGGNEFLVELNPSGSSLSYSARFPTNTVTAALALDASGGIHYAGRTGLVSTLTPGHDSAPRLFGLVNAAGGDLAGRVAPGELISIYGLHLGPSPPASGKFDAAGFLPTVLAGIQVTIDGTPAPLLYVSDTQINVVAPLELLTNTATALQVFIGSATLPDFRVVVDQAIPQVFRLSDGSTAVNQDGTVNSKANPAKTGSIISIWATGIGFTSGVDGQMATATQRFCDCIIHDGSRNQDILPSYAGGAPGLVTGIVQINFQVPAAINMFDSYYLTVNGKNSDMFSIFATP